MCVCVYMFFKQKKIIYTEYCTKLKQKLIIQFFLRSVSIGIQTGHNHIHREANTTDYTVNYEVPHVVVELVELDWVEVEEESG